jgi:hypothetical protein
MDNNTKFVKLLSNNSIINEATACWEWIGKRDCRGYAVMPMKDVRDCGSVYNRVNRELARRKLVELGELKQNELLPTTIVGGHQCNCKCCVNPCHVEPITQSKNVKDAYNAGLYKVDRVYVNKIKDDGFWDDELDNIIDFLKKGLSIKQIAVLYETSANALYIICYKNDINVVALKREAKRNVDTK